MRISRSDGVVTLRVELAGLDISFLLFFLHLTQTFVQAAEALVPIAPVGLHPARDFAQQCCLEPAETPLCLPGLGDEPRPLQHLQMLGDARLGHLEGCDIHAKARAWVTQFGDQLRSRADLAPCARSQVTKACRPVSWPSAASRGAVRGRDSGRLDVSTLGSAPWPLLRRHCRMTWPSQ